MSSSAVLGGIAINKPGLNYLVPSNWYYIRAFRFHQFSLLNHNNEPSSFQVPSLAILDHAYLCTESATPSSSTSCHSFRKN